MAVPPSLPITGKVVVAVDGVKRLSGEQGPRDDFEFFGILSAAQTAFQVLFELARINWNKHASESELLKQVIGVFAYQQLASRIRFSEGALRRFAGNGDV